MDFYPVSFLNKKFSTMVNLYPRIRCQLLNLEPLLSRLSASLALIAAITWFILDIFGPKPLDHGYQEQASEMLAAFFSGRESHPFAEYLSVFGVYLRAILFDLLYLAGALYVFAESIRPSEQHRYTGRQKNIAIFLIFLSFIVLRDPSLFTEPRFWAEEATVYFNAAYSSPFWEGLIAPHQGYFSLWANLASVLATLPPLEYAPVVTTVMALIVQLLLCITILINESELLNSSTKKAIACAAVLVVGAFGEIWLTTINSQHYLALLTFLILIDNKKNFVKLRVWYSIALFSGLSSIASNFLTPLFLLRYWQTRDKANLVLFLIFVFTSIVQLVAIGYSFFVNVDSANQLRFHAGLDIKKIIWNIYYFAFSYPVGGGFLSKISTPLLALILFYSRGQWRAWWVFLAAILLLTTLSVLSSIGMHGGPRYAYSSAVILMLMLLVITADSDVPFMARISSGVLLFLSITYWSTQFMFGLDNFRDSRWPTWSSEVAAWRLDPCRKLRVHPMWSDKAVRGTWSIDLPVSRLNSVSSDNCVKK